MVFGICSQASAHDSFQDVLKEEYTLKSFSCKACHPDSKDRKLRTPFAERIYQELKDKNLSAAYDTAAKKDEAAKAADPDFDDHNGAVAAFEKAANVDFKAAFKKVSQQTMTIDSMLKEGVFNGARLDTKKLEEMAAEKGE